MHATLKFAAVLAVATVGYFGLSSAGLLPGAGLFGSTERPLEVTFRPLQPLDAPSSDAPIEESRRAASEERVALPAELSSDSQATAPTPGSAVFRAVALQASGAPLAGAVLTIYASDDHIVPSEPSGADGAMRLELHSKSADHRDAIRDRHSIQAKVAHPGYASQWTSALIDLEREVHLGNFKLAQGGAISGRVMDASQRPVADALVSAESASGSRDELDRKRYEFHSSGQSSARTLSDGSFLLTGVQPGFARVWASGDGWLASFSPPVEVQVGQESMGVQLTVEPYPEHVLVCGRVVDPSGSPVAHANLHFAKTSKGNQSAGSHNADERGAFRYVLLPGWKLSLEASDPKGELDSASLHDLAGGVLDLELRLSKSQALDLFVRDEQEAFVEQYQVSVFAADGINETYSLPLASHPNGHLQLGRLADTFLLEVKAPGFSAARTEVLQRSHFSTPGAKIQLQLERIPGIRGRVLAGGVPVQGASVELITMANDDVDLSVNGLDSRVMPFPVDTSASDEHGQFLLTPRVAGRVFVRAGLTGFAPAEIGPLDVLPSVGVADLELALSVGGIIEGEVLLPTGPDAAGKIVGVSRADGRARTQRVGPDGLFRFERLTPGKWQVRLCEEEIGRSTSTRMGNLRKPKQLDFDCEVNEGRTTTFDIDLRGGSACRLVGTLAVDGGQAKAWTASLYPGEQWDGNALSKANVNSQGRYELEAPKPGPYTVALQGAFEGHDDQIIFATVDLRGGTTTHDFHFRMAKLIVEHVPKPESDNPELLHIGQGSNGELCLTVLMPDASGRCELANVPVGKGRIVRFDSGSMDPEQWPAVLHCEVKPKDSTTVVLP